jgi:hypothetical protein
MTASRRLLLPAIVIVLALSLWMAVAGVMTTSVRASTARGHVAAASQTISVQPQEDGEQGAPDGAESDDRVEVQVWTVAAVGIAMALGLVALLVRMLMGWMKPAPPPQEEAHH